MAKTQKNKATAKHLGLLKAKLAKLKKDLLDEQVRGALLGRAVGRWPPRASADDARRRVADGGGQRRRAERWLRCDEGAGRLRGCAALRSGGGLTALPPRR